MRIVFAALYCHNDVLTAGGPAGLLDSIPFHRELSTALAQAGHDVEVVFHSPVDAILQHQNVRFRFVASGCTARAASVLAKALGQKPARDPPAFRAIDSIAKAKADVVHLHGTALPLHFALLASRLDGEALVVQHHGGGPARRTTARWLQQRGFARADRFLVTTAAHARPFADAGMIHDPCRIETVIEVSTPFQQLDRDEARRRSGLVGDPIFISAGRLHPVKDPLTTLKGYELIAQAWPGSRLYFCYRTDELLPVLRRYTQERHALSERVRFLGRLPHDEMNAILGSADFLLQASLREWSGYAILEAIAVGTLPVVTRIDSFEEITEGGQHGVLFPIGDAEAMARSVLALDLAALPMRRRQLRAYFEDRLSYPAMARRLDEIYKGLLVDDRTVHRRTQGAFALRHSRRM